VRRHILELACKAAEHGRFFCASIMIAESPHQTNQTSTVCVAKPMLASQHPLTGHLQSMQEAKKQVQHSVALIDAQGAIRGTIREIISYAAGLRENVGSLSQQRCQQQFSSVRSCFPSALVSSRFGSSLTWICPRTRTAHNVYAPSDVCRNIETPPTL
jgi:hypothetical protein